MMAKVFGRKCAVSALLAVSLCACEEGAELEGGVDGSVPDGGSDARDDASSDAGLLCTLDHDYTFYFDGGLAPQVDKYELTTAGALRKTRMPFRLSDAGAESCTVPLPSCNTAGKIDASELAAAFSAAGLSAAFGDSSQVFGEDRRLVDGQVLMIVRDDGKKITVGNPCEQSSSCVPIPAPVHALATVLFELMQQHRGTPSLDGGAEPLCP